MTGFRLLDRSETLRGVRWAGVEGARPRSAPAPGVALGYRADIDGLRAFAVLPVVFNHLGMKGFFGGFIGVDIFFVISGYLITSILLRELEAGTYSTLGFYRRRILRIFPALFAFLAITTIVACATLLPHELQIYAQSVVATVTFSANILFNAQSNYFEAAARLKPLLHTWSLAVEEQFYIFWPPILAFLFQRERARLVWWIGGGLVASLIMSVGMSVLAPTADFYLAPPRAWELLGGALIAAAPPRLPRWAAEAAAAAGFLTILVSIKAMQGGAYPGWHAAIPCLGSGLVILAGTQEATAVSRFLSWRPIVFVGLISYSLYLWHWPVIVFAQLALFKGQTLPVQLAEMAVSLLLATLSWWFVERPFRHVPRGTPSWKVVGLGVTAIGAAACVAGMVLATGGLPGRFTPAEQRIAAYETYDGDQRFRGGTCFVVEPTDRFDSGACLDWRPNRGAVLLAGDSHAAHLWPGLSTFGDRVDVLQATHTGCRPMLYPGTARDACGRFFHTLFNDWLPTHPVQALVLGGRWTVQDLPDLRRTLSDPAIKANRPVLVGPAPQYTASLPRLLTYAMKNRDDRLVARALVPDVFRLDRRMAALAASTGTPYVSLVDLLCARSVCLTRASDGVPMQFDYGHFTVDGSREVMSLMKPRWLSLLRLEGPRT